MTGALLLSESATSLRNGIGRVVPEMNRLNTNRAIPHPRYKALSRCRCVGGLEAAGEGFAEGGAGEAQEVEGAEGGFGGHGVGAVMARADGRGDGGLVDCNG